jgi:hypothetical protein
MDHIRERVISISLNEAEWQAFVALHPQPVTWLRERIKESIGAEAPMASSAISSSLRPVSAAASTTSATRQ